MKAIYYSLVIFLIMAFNLPAQVDSTQLIKVKNFRVSYECEDVYENSRGDKDTSTETATLKECKSAQVYQDSLLLVYHNKGKEIIPFNKITGLKFPGDNNKTVMGVVFGVMSGTVLWVGSTLLLSTTTHGEGNMAVGMYFIYSAPIFVVGGAIIGGVLKPDFGDYVNHNLENIPPEKRKEKVLKLLIERSKLKKF